MLVLNLLDQVIAINGLFPGPLINTTTNDFVHVNVFNNMDEPLLFTWYANKQFWIDHMLVYKSRFNKLGENGVGDAGMGYSKG